VTLWENAKAPTRPVYLGLERSTLETEFLKVTEENRVAEEDAWERSMGSAHASPVRKT